MIATCIECGGDRAGYDLLCAGCRPLYSGSLPSLASSEPNAATASISPEARQDSDPSFVAGPVAEDSI